MTTAQDPTPKHNIFDYNKMCMGAFGYNGSGWSHNTVNGFQALVNIWGFHVDCAFNAEGNNEGNTGTDIYYGYRTWAVHVGYSFPICEWFKIAPVVGYNYWGKGYYDGLDYTVDGNGIHNKFTPLETHKGFDYGVVLSVEIAKFIVLYANIERHNIGVGLGISFRKDSWWM